MMNIHLPWRSRDLALAQSMFAQYGPLPRNLSITIAIYYRILEYSEPNLCYLRDHFAVKTLTDPGELMQVHLSEVEVLFAPLGFVVDRSIIDAAPQLKVIVSNTTGIAHIDADAVCERGLMIATFAWLRNFLSS